MQKTFIEKVHPFLNHEESVVQDFALSLLEKSYQANEETLPIVLEANKHRKKTSLRNLPIVYAMGFPISENCFLELFQQIKTLSKKSEDYRTAVILLMNSPISLLQKYQEQIESLFNVKQKELLQELLRLFSLSTSELFSELTKYAEQSGIHYDNRIFQIAGKIIEILSARSDWDRKKVEVELEREIQEGFVSNYGIFIVILAGEERMQQLIPALVKLLFKDLDQDVLVEEATAALIKIGTNEVIDWVKPYVNDDETGSFAVDVLIQIKSSYAEEVLLQLIEEVEIEPVRTLIADALCKQLSIKAVPIVEKIIEGEYSTWYLDLEEPLYCNCVMNEIDHPKLKQWKEEMVEMDWSEDDFGLLPTVTWNTEPIRTEPKIGRNDPCSCGSGKKFKKCCGK
jgi:hypothetical protein